MRFIQYPSINPPMVEKMAADIADRIGNLEEIFGVTFDYIASFGYSMLFLSSRVASILGRPLFIIDDRFPTLYNASALIPNPFKVNDSNVHLNRNFVIMGNFWSDFNLFAAAMFLKREEGNHGEKIGTCAFVNVSHTGRWKISIGEFDVFFSYVISNVSRHSDFWRVHKKRMCPIFSLKVIANWGDDNDPVSHRIGDFSVIFDSVWSLRGIGDSLAVVITAASNKIMRDNKYYQLGVLFLPIVEMMRYIGGREKATNLSDYSDLGVFLNAVFNTADSDADVNWIYSDYNELFGVIQFLIELPILLGEILGHSEDDPRIDIPEVIGILNEYRNGKTSLYLRLMNRVKGDIIGLLLGKISAGIRDLLVLYFLSLLDTVLEISSGHREWQKYAPKVNKLNKHIVEAFIELFANIETEWNNLTRFWETIGSDVWKIADLDASKLYGELKECAVILGRISNKVFSFEVNTRDAFHSNRICGYFSEFDGDDLPENKIEPLKRMMIEDFFNEYVVSRYFFDANPPVMNIISEYFADAITALPSFGKSFDDIRNVLLLISADIRSEVLALEIHKKLSGRYKYAEIIYISAERNMEFLSRRIPHPKNRSISVFFVCDKIRSGFGLWKAYNGVKLMLTALNMTDLKLESDDGKIRAIAAIRYNNSDRIYKDIPTERFEIISFLDVRNPHILKIRYPDESMKQLSIPSDRTVT